VRALANHLAAPLEAALLRERGERVEQFRAGLSQLARRLAGAASVEEVLRLTGSATSTLLNAVRSDAWLREPDGTYRTADGATRAPSLAGIEGIAHPDLLPAQRVARFQTDTHARDLVLAFLVGQDPVVEAVVVAHRDPDADPFTVEDERRAREIAEHASGALRRARASAEAAEAEALRALDRMKNEFLDAVSHDLKNPLAVVAGYGELLAFRAEKLTPAMAVDMADGIRRATVTATSIVEDLLTAAKHERGQLSLNRDAVKVGTFLERLWSDFRVFSDGDRIRLDLPDGPDLWISADRTRLQQIVANFLTNAVRYAPDGDIVLRARRDKSDVVIEVEDRGVGIPVEEQPYVWDKFYRASNSRDDVNGTGIGLAVVRTLTELHGGRVDLDSTPGLGSTFRVILPVLYLTPIAGGDTPAHRDRQRSA
jgi:signal transduction histidine kinase